MARRMDGIIRCGSGSVEAWLPSTAVREARSLQHDAGARPWSGSRSSGGKRRCSPALLRYEPRPATQRRCRCSPALRRPRTTSTLPGCAPPAAARIRVFADGFGHLGAALEQAGRGVHRKTNLDHSRPAGRHTIAVRAPFQPLLPAAHFRGSQQRSAGSGRARSVRLCARHRHRGLRTRAGRLHNTIGLKPSPDCFSNPRRRAPRFLRSTACRYSRPISRSMRAHAPSASLLCRRSTTRSPRPARGVAHPPRLCVFTPLTFAWRFIPPRLHSSRANKVNARSVCQIVCIRSLPCRRRRVALRGAAPGRRDAAFRTFVLSHPSCDLRRARLVAARQRSRPPMPSAASDLMLESP